MAEEARIFFPAEVRVVQQPAALLLEENVQLATPTAEQLQSCDGLFAREQESQQVANVLGLWTSVLLAHDLARNLAQDRKEEEAERLASSPSPPEH